MKAGALSAVTDKRLYIIDTTSAFFTKIPKTEKVINWSKVPYPELEKNGRIRKKYYKKIYKNFVLYIRRVKQLGYTAVSIDSIARLVSYPFYPASAKKKIAKYRKQLGKIFKAADREGLKIFLTSDLMFFNQYIKKYAGQSDEKILRLLKTALHQIFTAFPVISGVIFRIGESDGMDVKGDFLSRVVVKSAPQLNRYIKSLLPVFEKWQKTMILRNWTVGGYSVGDMMWNKKKYRQALRGVTSPHFIFSMKYGDTDFFRYVKLNHFFYERDGIRKIIELQTRREYEGFGQYPSFIGWDYQRFYNVLKDHPDFAGIHVWCQTGGWSGYRSFTFLKNTSYWNELNTSVTVDIFKSGCSVRDAVKKFYDESPPYKEKLLPKKRISDFEDFMTFLRLSDRTVKNILYTPGFSSRTLYFNKVRVPPLLNVFWHNVNISLPILLFFSAFTKNKGRSLKKSWETLLAMRRMNKISRKYGYDYDFNFHFETFKIFYLCKRFMFFKKRAYTKAKLLRYIKYYHRRYPETYHFTIHYEKKWFSFLLKRFFIFLIRDKMRYRILDRILFNRATGRLYYWVYQLTRKSMPGFLDKYGMPVSAILS